jgi:alcohol dehydrogenase class IV/8-oxo-dGTP pyrophosphatase MutT (NUDIX family)
MKPELTTLCYIERENSYLMLHRTKKEHDINKDKWIGVGGHLEPDETPEECVRREVREETGLTLHSLTFRGVIHFSSPHDAEEMFIYTSDHFSGELGECREGELSWVKMSEVLDLNLWEGDRIFLPLLMGSSEFFSFSLRYSAEGKLLANPLEEKNTGLVILQGRDTITTYAHRFQDYGKKALIVTGKNSTKQNGALADIEKALTSEGIAFEIFDEVEENPSTDTIMKAREAGLNAQVSFVIGVGGGSPLDAAKAIALMIKNHDEEKDFLYEKDHETTALPVIAVPTTCGTGSEATGVSVLTRKERRSKGSIPFSIYPELALVDEKYLETAPKELIGNTAVDSLSHLLESCLNSRATEYSRACALQGLSVWRRVKDVVSQRREATEEDMRDLMTASTLAGMSIAITGTCLPHALSYTLTVEAEIPHGKAAGYFLSRFVKEAGEDGLMLLRTAGFFDAEELDGFYRAVCKPGSIEKSVLLKAVETVAVNPSKLSAAPFAVDREVLQRIAGVE